ncbi:MAG: DUF3592 domain-containing protein [Planctomycetia bacterium]|nr:DUF3592 domain-containing protein [Planctomycetia bacterium]
MSRSFRVYQKKRGHRRTGSGKLGRVGEILFFATFLLFGCVGLVVILVALVIPEWRANHEFVETICTVRSKELGQTQGEDGTLYRPEIGIEYAIDGGPHFAKTYDMCGSYSSDRAANQAILAQFDVGRQYPCWYDPLDHDVVVLARGYTWWLWLTFVVPISFLLLGGGGLLYRTMRWGRSAEHLAATARSANSRDGVDSNGSSRNGFPNVPVGTELTNSPGTRLRFRLPISAAGTWVLIGALVACGFWNGIVSVFVVKLGRDFMAGRPQWWLMLFMVPFVVAGIGLIVFFVRQVLIATGIGPTLVEISDHPLRPGRTYRLFVSQAGRLRMNSLVVQLVCDEHVRYRQGTDTRTETRRVHRQEIHGRKDFAIRLGEPWAMECDFSVPPGGMHSFKSENNEVRWSLEVQGDVAGWPDFKRAFPVIVYPDDPTERALA